MDEVYNKIQAMAEDGNGFVKTSQIEAAGINRAVLKKYVDSGLLERIRKGIYAPADCDIDEFAFLQVQCSSLIFSYGTALYIWGLTDIRPVFKIILDCLNIQLLFYLVFIFNQITKTSLSVI